MNKYNDGSMMYTIGDFEKLTAERDAALAREAELVAQVEVLRNLFPLKIPVSCEGFLNYPLRKYNEVVDAFNSAPQQHLRDIQAEAGRASAEQVIAECQLIVARATTTYRENPGMGFSSTIEDKTAKQLKQELSKELEVYAERVKAGEV